MATTRACPWNIPASIGGTAGAPSGGDAGADASTSAASPSGSSMQQIMDEALALRLYEDECRALERELNASAQGNVFAHLQTSSHERDAQRLGAHSFADFEDYEEFYEDEGDAGEQAPLRPSWAAVSGAGPSRATATTSAAAALTAATASRSSSLTPTMTTTTNPSVQLSAHTKKNHSQPQAPQRPQYDRSMPTEDAGKGFTSVRESARRQHKLERRGLSGRAEAERLATRDGVLDTRTQRLLQQLINRGTLDAVHGCVQAGKEARVFVAEGTDEATLRPRSFAVKVFKTTLGEFSNRHEYVSGDHRFDAHFAKKSMRRQLVVWTEKELRNLYRAARHVRVPQPLLAKEHVLVMEFVGDDGYPAPTLKVALASSRSGSLSRKQLAHAYADVLQGVRALYQDARLVHADLSEYNVLVHRRACWLIDFGQAVERTHPDAATYLARDLRNMHRFFESAGLPYAEPVGGEPAADGSDIPDASSSSVDTADAGATADTSDVITSATSAIVESTATTGATAAVAGAAKDTVATATDADASKESGADNDAAITDSADVSFTVDADGDGEDGAVSDGDDEGVDVLGLLSPEAELAFVTAESPEAVLALFPALRALLEEKRQQHAEHALAHAPRDD